MRAEQPSRPPAQSSTITKLRELIEAEHEKPVEAPVAAPVVFRDDYGRVITQLQWHKLQRIKEKAKAGGYEIDDYSQ